MSTNINEARENIENCNNKEPTQEMCEMCTARHLCTDSVYELKGDYSKELFNQLNMQNELLRNFLPI